MKKLNRSSSSWGYCSDGQLVAERKTGAVTSADLYEYDASGNRTKKTEQRQGVTDVIITNTYNNMNQLVSSYNSGTNATTTYSYNDYGSLIGDGTYTYDYDYYEKLTFTYNLETKKLCNYEYYFDDIRMKKGETCYIWLDGNMVYEFTSTDSSDYTYGHRLISSDDYKYVLNAHGDVVALLDSTGTVIKRYDYDAFGNEQNIDSTDTNPFRYCAEYFDKETGSIYLRARYYQPVTGRFTQIDPHWNVFNMIYGDKPTPPEYEDNLGLNTYTVRLPDYAAIRQSGNLYGYCLNNPTKFIDPEGEAVWLIAVIVGGVTLLLTGCSALDRNAWLENNISFKSTSSLFVPDANGYYGTPGSSSRVRNMEGGLSTATSMFSHLTIGYVNEYYDNNGALIRVMPDGTIYTFREESSSDGTPAIDINGKSSGVKSQKIHFTS